MSVRVRKTAPGWYAVDVLTPRGWWTAEERHGKPTRAQAEYTARQCLAQMGGVR